MDIPATATPITDEPRRRDVFNRIAEGRTDGRAMDVDAWVEARWCRWSFTPKASAA